MCLFASLASNVRNGGDQSRWPWIADDKSELAENQALSREQELKKRGGVGMMEGVGVHYWHGALTLCTVRAQFTLNHNIGLQICARWLMSLNAAGT
jgi:hypothetical protein